MKFIEQPQYFRMQLCSPVFSVVVYKNHTRSQRSKTGQGIKPALNHPCKDEEIKAKK